MDASVVSETGGFLEWVSTYGNIIFFFAQLIFWFGLLILLGYAVVQYKRWVNYQLGTGKSGSLPGAGGKGGSKVSVDKFVE